MCLSARCHCTPFIEKTEQYWQAMEPSHKNVSYANLVVWNTNDHHINCCRMYKSLAFWASCSNTLFKYFPFIKTKLPYLSIRLPTNSSVCYVLLCRTMFQQPFPIKTLVWRQSWMRLAMLFCCLSVILVKTWLSYQIMNILQIVPQENVVFFLLNNNRKSNKIWTWKWQLIFLAFWFWKITQIDLIEQLWLCILYIHHIHHSLWRTSLEHWTYFQNTPIPYDNSNYND